MIYICKRSEILSEFAIRSSSLTDKFESETLVWAEDSNFGTNHVLCMIVPLNKTEITQINEKRNELRICDFIRRHMKGVNQVITF